MHQFHDGIDEHHEGQVVGNLLMVGLDLETEGEAEERRAEEGRETPGQAGSDGGRHGRLRSAISSSAVGVHQRRKHPGHEGDGLHLGVVAHLDNLEVVAAEGHGDGSSHGHGPAYTQGQEQQEGAQQAHENPRGRALARKQQLVERLRVVSSVLGGDGRGGHAAEHGVRPVRGVVRMGLVPLTHLVRHAHIAGDVALVHDLAVQHLRHKTVTQGQEQGHDAQGQGYFLPNILHTHLFTDPSLHSG